MPPLNGLGRLGNGKGKLRAWYMPRWVAYVRMFNESEVNIVIGKSFKLQNDKIVLVKNDEVIRVYP